MEGKDDKVYCPHCKEQGKDAIVIKINWLSRCERCIRNISKGDVE